VTRKLYVNPIVTGITPARTWYEAEPYHQEYFARIPSKATVQPLSGRKWSSSARQLRRVENVTSHGVFRYIPDNSSIGTSILRGKVREIGMYGWRCSHRAIEKQNGGGRLKD